MNAIRNLVTKQGFTCCPGAHWKVTLCNLQFRLFQFSISKLQPYKPGPNFTIDIFCVSCNFVYMFFISFLQFFHQFPNSSHDPAQHWDNEVAKGIAAKEMEMEQKWLNREGPCEKNLAPASVPNWFLQHEPCAHIIRNHASSLCEEIDEDRTGKQYVPWNMISITFRWCDY